jgi:protein TonB
MMKRIHRLLWSAALLVSTAALAADKPRKAIVQTEPEYPAIARSMNLHGVVKLKMIVGADGLVKRVEYVGGHPVLAESAVKAVKTWKYEPGPSETVMQVDVKF